MLLENDKILVNKKRKMIKWHLRDNYALHTVQDSLHVCHKKSFKYTMGSKGLTSFYEN